MPYDKKTGQFRAYSEDELKTLRPDWYPPSISEVMSNVLGNSATYTNKVMGVGPDAVGWPTEWPKTPSGVPDVKQAYPVLNAFGLGKNAVGWPATKPPDVPELDTRNPRNRYPASFFPEPPAAAPVTPPDPFAKREFGQAPGNLASMNAALANRANFGSGRFGAAQGPQLPDPNQGDKPVSLPLAWERIKQTGGAVDQAVDYSLGLEYLGKALYGKDIPKLSEAYGKYVQAAKYAGAEPMKPQQYFENMGTKISYSMMPSDWQRIEIEGGARKDVIKGGVRDFANIAGQVAGQGAFMSVGGGAGTIASKLLLKVPGLRSAPAWIQKAVGSVAGAGVTGGTYQGYMEGLQEAAYPKQQTFGQHMADVGSTAGYWAAYGAVNPAAEKIMKGIGGKLGPIPQFLEKQLPATTEIGKSVLEGGITGTMVGTGMFAGELAKTGDAKKAWAQLSNETKGEMQENFAESILYALMKRGGKAPGVPHERDVLNEMFDHVYQNASPGLQEQFDKVIQHAKEQGYDDQTAQNVLMDYYSKSKDGEIAIAQASQHVFDKKFENDFLAKQAEGAVPADGANVAPAHGVDPAAEAQTASPTAEQLMQQNAAEERNRAQQMIDALNGQPGQAAAAQRAIDPTGVLEGYNFGQYKAPETGPITRPAPVTGREQGPMQPFAQGEVVRIEGQPGIYQVASDARAATAENPNVAKKRRVVGHDGTEIEVAPQSLRKFDALQVGDQVQAKGRDGTFTISDLRDGKKIRVTDAAGNTLHFSPDEIAPAFAAPVAPAAQPQPAAAPVAPTPTTTQAAPTAATPTTAPAAAAAPTTVDTPVIEQAPAPPSMIKQPVKGSGTAHNFKEETTKGGYHRFVVPVEGGRVVITQFNQNGGASKHYQSYFQPNGTKEQQLGKVVEGKLGFDPHMMDAEELRQAFHGHDSTRNAQNPEYDAWTGQHPAVVEQKQKQDFVAYTGEFNPTHLYNGTDPVEVMTLRNGKPFIKFAAADGDQHHSARSASWDELQLIQDASHDVAEAPAAAPADQANPLQIIDLHDQKFSDLTEQELSDIRNRLSARRSELFHLDTSFHDGTGNLQPISERERQNDINKINQDLKTIDKRLEDLKSANDGNVKAADDMDWIRQMEEAARQRLAERNGGAAAPAKPAEQPKTEPAAETTGIADASGVKTGRQPLGSWRVADLGYYELADAEHADDFHRQNPNWTRKMEDGKHRFYPPAGTTEQDSTSEHTVNKDAQRAKEVADKGYLEFGSHGAAADLFAQQHPDWTRKFEDGKHRFYPPASQQPKAEPAAETTKDGSFTITKTKAKNGKDRYEIRHDDVAGRIELNPTDLNATYAAAYFTPGDQMELRYIKHSLDEAMAWAKDYLAGIATPKQKPSEPAAPQPKADSTPKPGSEFTTFEKAETGKPVKAEMYQGRGATPEEIYGPEAVQEGRAVPILGPGQYYADTKEDASIYGKDVKQHTVTLQNPFVISSYGQWHTLMGRAGAQHLDSRGPLHYQESEKIPEATKKLQSYLTAQGHDGVVIRMGENDKGLHESFGHNQMVVFGGAEAKTEEKPAPAANANENKPTDKRLEKLFHSVSPNDDEIEAVRRAIESGAAKNILLSYGTWKPGIQPRGKDNQLTLHDFVERVKGNHTPTIIVDNGAYSGMDVGFWEIMNLVENRLQNDSEAVGRVYRDELENGINQGQNDDPFVAGNLRKIFPEFKAFHDWMDWLQQHRDVIDYVIAPDSMDPSIPVEARQQLADYAYNFFSGFDLKFIPVFQYGADTSHVDELISEGADYIAIGGTIGKLNPDLKSDTARVAYVRSIVEKYPDVKFHLLGSQDQWLFDRVPGLYSADGTTWRSAAADKTPTKEQAIEQGITDEERQGTRVDNLTNEIVTRDQQAEDAGAKTPKKSKSKVKVTSTDDPNKIEITIGKTKYQFGKRSKNAVGDQPYTYGISGTTGGFGSSGTWQTFERDMGRDGDGQTVIDEIRRIALERGWDLDATTAMPIGHTTTVKTEAGREIEVRYKITNAKKHLEASHDPDTLTPNRDYPTELQPRDRSRVASEEQIQRIAANLEPTYLGESPKASDGAPIVSNKGIVESGNGRILALLRVYKNHPNQAEKYRSWLQANLTKFGFSEDALDGIETPVLVRERTTSLTPAERAEFVHESNVSAVSAMSPMEQARADAGKIKAGLISLFNPSEDGNISAAGNREFVRGFMQTVVPANERGRYVDAEGALSQDGVRRITNAIFARVYGSSPALERLAESNDNNVRNITTAMLLSARNMLRLKAAIENGDAFDTLDLTDDITAAVNKLSQLRDKGESVDDFFNQGDMFGEQLSPEAKAVLAMFDAAKQRVKRITDFLNYYAQAAMDAGSPNQGSLFGDMPKPTKADMLQAAVNKLEGETGEQITLYQEQSQSGPTNTADHAGQGNSTQTPEDAAGPTEAVEQSPATLQDESFDRNRDVQELADFQRIVATLQQDDKVTVLHNYSVTNKQKDPTHKGRYVYTTTIQTRESTGIIKVFNTNGLRYLESIGRNFFPETETSSTPGFSLNEEGFKQRGIRILRIERAKPTEQPAPAEQPKQDAQSEQQQPPDYDDPSMGAYYFAHKLPKPDAVYQNRTYSHGLHAFSEWGALTQQSVKMDLNKTLKKIDYMLENPTHMISASDEQQPIGSVGVFTKGDVHAVSPEDIDSVRPDKRNMKGHDGKRLIHHMNVKGLFTNAGEHYEKFQRKVKGLNEKFDNRAGELNGGYIEAILSPTSIEGIWYRQDSLTVDELAKLQQYAKDNNLPVWEIANQKEFQKRLVYDPANGENPAPAISGDKTAAAQQPEVQNDGEVNAADDADWVKRMEDAARQRIKDRKGRMMSGLPMDDLADYAVIGFAKIVRGVRDFKKFSEEMIDEFGPSIKIYMGAIYGQAMSMLDMSRDDVREIVQAAQKNAAPQPEQKPQETQPPKDEQPKQPPAPPKNDTPAPEPTPPSPPKEPTTWRDHPWGKDAKKSHELGIYLDSFQDDEKRIPTIADAVKEAKYLLSTFHDGGHANNEDLDGTNGADVAKTARSEVKAIEAFIRKYESEADTNDNVDQSNNSGEHSGGTGSSREGSSSRTGGQTSSGGGRTGRGNNSKPGDSGRSDGGRNNEPGNDAGHSGVDNTTGGQRPADVVDQGPTSVPNEVSPGSAEPGGSVDAGAQRNEELESGERVGIDVPNFVEYVPQRITGQDHPGDVVEPFGLSLVEYPQEAFTDPKYAPLEIVKKGTKEAKLSDMQLEVVSLAKYNFDNGKRGMLIADDTGIGKTAEQVAIAADAFHSGKAKRILIVTKNDQVADGFINENEKFGFELPMTLVNSKSHRNFKDDHNLNLPKTQEKMREMAPKERDAFRKRMSQNPYTPLGVKDGVMVMSPTTFRTATQAVNEWLRNAGGDVIVMFDESHVFKNVTGVSATATAARDLFNNFKDNGQFIYSSATAAEDIAGMEHLYGLRLWPIDGFNDFRARLQGVQSSLAGSNGSPFDRELPLVVMEQIIRELKGRGQYVGRALSMDGIEMEGLPIELTQDDLDEWGRASEFVLHVARSAEPFKKRSKQTAFVVGYMRRLRGYYVMKGVIRWMQANTKNGVPPRVALNGFFKNGEDEETGENAMLEAAINQIQGGAAADDVRNELLSMLHGQNGERPVPFLPSPVDMLSKAFGDKNIAVIDGDHSPAQRMDSVQKFQSGKARIIYFTQAGNTGINLHDLTNEQITFIPIDYPWEAKEQKQSEGRVNRTGQKTKPRYLYPYTPSSIDKKFVGTLKARYESMGALSRGKSINLGGDSFGDFDFSGPVAKQAVFNAIPQLTPEQIGDMFGREFAGLFPPAEEGSTTDDSVLDVNRNVYAIFKSGDAVKKFLNSLMLLDVETGNEVFNKFVESFQAVKEAMDMEGGVASTFESYYGEQLAASKGEGNVTVRKIKTNLTADQRKAIQGNLKIARKNLNAAERAKQTARATAIDKIQEKVTKDKTKQADLRSKYQDAKQAWENASNPKEVERLNKRRNKIGADLGKVNERIMKNEQLLARLRAGGAKAELAYQEVPAVKKAERAHEYATFKLMEAEAQAEANDRVMMLDGQILTAGKMVPLKAAIRRAARERYGGDESRIPQVALRIEIRGYMLKDGTRVVGVVVPAWAEKQVLEALRVQPVQGLTNDGPAPTGQRTLAAGRKAKKGRIIKRLKDTTRVLTPKTAHAIADILAQEMDVVIYEGRVTPGAEGVYNQLKNQAIRVRARSGDNWRTVGHELAHAFVANGSIIGDSKELKALADGLYPNPLAIPKGLEEEEGFAEFFRLWVADPDLAEQYAPLTTAAFEQYVASDPMLQPLFAKIMLLVSEDFKDGPTARAARAIISSEWRGERDDTNTRGPQYKLDKAERLLFNVADFTIPAKHLDAALKEAASKPDLSLQKLMSIMGDSKAKALLTFTRVPVDSKGYHLKGPVLLDLYKKGITDIIKFMGNKKINLAGLELRDKKIRNSSDYKKSLYSTYKKMGAKDAFDALLLALRVNERYSTGNYEDGKLPLTKDHAKEIIAEATQKYPDAIQAARELTTRFSDVVLELTTREDVITAKTAQNVKDGSDWYIPFFYVDGKTPASTGADNTGRRNRNPIKRFFGQNKPVIDAYQAMLLKLMEVHQAIEHKRVLNLLHNMAETGEVKHFMSMLPPRMDVTEISSEQIAEAIFRKTNVDLSQALQNIASFKFFSPNRNLDPNRNTIINIKNGKAREIELAKDLFDSVMAMKPVQVEAFGKWLRNVTRAQRFTGLVTLRYFFSTMFMRDPGTVLLQSDKPFKAFRHYIDSFGAMFGTKKGDSLYASFVQSGAALGAMENMLQNIGRNNFGDDIIDIPAAGWGKVKKGAKMMWVRVVRSSSEAMRVLEEAPRIAEYVATWKTEVAKLGHDANAMHKLYLEQGTEALPQEVQDAMERILVDAAYAAREVTTNFGLHGAHEGIRKYMPTVPFLPGNVQGFYKFIRTIRQHPVRSALRATSLGTLSVLSHFMMLGLINLLGDDDDEIKRRRHDYLNMDSALRDKYWWYPVVPGFDISMGKPFDYAIPSNIIERILEQQSGEPGARQWHTDIGKMLLSSIVNTDYINNIVQIYQDIQSNKTNFGGQIVPVGEQDLAKNLRSGPDTSMTSRHISDFLTDTFGIFGGPSPREMDYAVKGVLGRYGTGLLNVSDFAFDLANGGNLKSAFQAMKPTAGTAHLPIAGQILYDRSELGGSRRINKFYADLEQARGYSSSAATLIAQKNTTLPGWANEKGLNLLRALPMLDEVASQMTDMNDMFKAGINDPKTNPRDREHYRLQQNYWREMLAGIPYGREPLPPDPSIGITPAAAEQMYAYVTSEIGIRLAGEANKPKGSTDQWQYYMWLKNGQ